MRIGDCCFGLRNQGSQTFPAERTLDGGDLVFVFRLGGEHGLGHAEQGSRRCVERLGAIDHVVLVGAIGAPEDGAEHLVKHGERGVGENGLHLAREHHHGRQAARRVETRDIAGNEDGDFSRDCRVTSAMNTLLAIRSDAELAHGLQSFNEGDEISLARGFRPLPQPGERRAIFVIGDGEQSFQPGDRLWRQTFDEISVSAFASKSTRR